MTMTYEQVTLFAIMGSVLGMLLWGRIRYDVVSFGALAVAVLLGVVNKDQAFAGFGHPAVIIIALVLIVSRSLQLSGAIEMITRNFVDASRSLTMHISVMAGIGATLSAFMNNVAALALLMPVDMQAANKSKRSPALSLMPLSFATILGGMVTLIGTPPNIVIAQFRETALGEPFKMFDFAPVGLACAAVGIAYVAMIGWRFLPVEATSHNSAEELEDLEGYVVEVGVPANSPAVGQTVRDLFPVADENDAVILGVVRRGQRLPGFAAGETLRKGDILVVEAGPDAVEQFAGALKLVYSSSSKHTGPLAGTLSMTEAVVPIGARIEGRSALDVRLLYRHGVMLMGISRQGKRFRERVRRVNIKAGDILLLMGPEDQLNEVVNWLGCMPLAERGLQVTQRDKASLAISIFAVAIIAASIGVVYLPVALAACVVAYVLLKVISLSQLYEAIEWPVIVLLASLIPIGAALEQSGGTSLIAQLIVTVTVGLPVVAVLVLMMVVTMTLSDVLNNVATVLIAAPVAVDVANRLQVNPDSLLMTVAVAASCAFLTPIGHKNNTIIMGPGGYRFGDYWRMGLPLEIIIVIVSVPAILFFWPL